MTLSKDEFTNELFKKTDDIYKAYLLAVEGKSVQDQLIQILDCLPETHASDPIMTEKQKDVMIDSLKKAQKQEQIAFTIGKVVLSIAIKAATM